MSRHKCNYCGHRQDLHYIDNGNRLRKCFGESFPCDCIREYYESDNE